MEHTENKSKERLKEIKEKIESKTKYKVKNIKCIYKDNIWFIEIELENYKNKFQLESIKNNLMLNYMLDEIYAELETEKQNS